MWQKDTLHSENMRFTCAFSDTHTRLAGLVCSANEELEGAISWSTEKPYFV